MTKIASSPTITGLTKLLNEYYYSQSYKINSDLTVSNNKGAFNKVIVKKLKHKFVLYENY